MGSANLVRCTLTVYVLFFFLGQLLAFPLAASQVPLFSRVSCLCLHFLKSLSKLSGGRFWSKVMISQDGGQSSKSQFPFRAFLHVFRRDWARFGQTEAGFLSSVRFERLPNIRLGNRGRRAPCSSPFGSFVSNFCFGKCKTQW